MKTNTELLTVLCVMSVHKIVLQLIFAATAVQRRCKWISEITPLSSLERSVLVSNRS